MTAKAENDVLSIAEAKISAVASVTGDENLEGSLCEVAEPIVQAIEEDTDLLLETEDNEEQEKL